MIFQSLCFNTFHIDSKPHKRKQIQCQYSHGMLYLLSSSQTSNLKKTKTNNEKSKEDALLYPGNFLLLDTNKLQHYDAIDNFQTKYSKTKS